MKKIVLILTMVMMVFSSSLSLATEATNNPPVSIGQTSGNIVENEADNSEKHTAAADKVLENMSKKERKIAEYTDKYNSETHGITAYYIEVVQLYSIPVFIIFLIIGAFNFFIVGEKKLDKKEQGFSFIMASLCGLVFFQVLPFLYALLVAGR